MNIELTDILRAQGVDFVYFVDVSHVSSKQNKNLPHAILLGITLAENSKEAFNAMELKTDRLADFTAGYLAKVGYKAHSQSEENILRLGEYDEQRKHTPMPHKSVAGLAGLGWIGKHDLIIHPVFGSAFSMCTVLTDAPVRTEKHPPAISQCGDCHICRDVCLPGAISGKEWHPGVSRDELVDVAACTSCFQCAVSCPWTQSFIQKEQLKTKV
jgi:epoxyqueuosine reductase QueG